MQATPLTAPSGIAQNPPAQATPPEQGQSDQASQRPRLWLEFVKSIPGTMIGGALGFGLGLYGQRKARIAEERKQAALAVVILEQQRKDIADGLVPFFKQVKSDSTRLGIPPWTRTSEFFFHFAKGLTIDIGKLGFVSMADVSGKTISLLASAERDYRELEELLQIHNRCVRELHDEYRRLGLPFPESSASLPTGHPELTCLKIDAYLDAIWNRLDTYCHEQALIEFKKAKATALGAG